MQLTDYIVIPSNLWVGIYATSSAVICDPPVLDTDKDFILCSKEPGALIDYLIKNEFEVSINEGYELDPDDGITCLRKLDVNLVVTRDYGFYLKFV